MDQFTYAERATDWRGNNNIAESIFEQMALERHPVPALDRGRRRHRRHLRDDRPVRPLPAATTPGSASSTRRTRCSSTADAPAIATLTHGRAARASRASAGRGWSRRSARTSIDRMIAVPDARLAVPRCVALGRGPAARVGGSTGTDLWGALGLIAGDAARGRNRVGGHPALRRRRAVPRHLLRRRVAGDAGTRYRSAPALPGAGMCQRALGARAEPHTALLGPSWSRAARVRC